MTISGDCRYEIVSSHRLTLVGWSFILLQAHGSDVKVIILCSGEVLTMVQQH